MPTTIEQYREAKSHYLKLRNQAKKDLMVRFNELAGELLRLQRELEEDFGEKVPIPSNWKKSRASKASKPAPPKPPEPEIVPPSAKEVAIQKQLDRHRKKLADTHAAGRPTKVIEDRIYELEDELRLAHAK